MRAGLLPVILCLVKGISKDGSALGKSVGEISNQETNTHLPRNFRNLKTHSVIGQFMHRRGGLDKIVTDILRIGTWMKRDVVAVQASTSVKEAAALLVDRRVGTLPVVDEARMLIGILAIADITHIFLPDVVSLLDDIDFVKDFGALKTPSERDLERAETLTVADIMEEAVSVEEDCSLLRALSVMEKHNLRDLPVVTRRGQLAGIASRVDIGRALLTNWLETTS